MITKSITQQMNISLVMACLLLTHQVATAQSSSTNSENENSTTLKNFTGVTESSSTSSSLKGILRQKKFEDDSVITDTKLKADEGSRSEYSMKFNLSFSGPPIGDLNNRKQPNPDGSIGTYDTRISGSISGRYRISPETALSLGSGVTALNPIQGVTRYDMNNPFIGYDISSKWMNLQLRNAFSLIDATNPDYMAVGETGGVTYANYAVYNVNQSKLALALESSLSYWFFNRGYVKSDKTAGTYSLAFYPYLKYNATSKLNINTSLAIQYMNPRAADNPSVLSNKTISQQLALGYAFSKDVYFSPNINFYPAKLTADSTTINFSTTFSLL